MTIGACYVIAETMKGQRITQKFVESMMPTGRDFVIWDRDLKGFGLKVTASGSKVYVVQYRQGGRGSPTKRRTLGKDGSPWSATSARGEAQRLLHMVGLGHDPVEEVKEQKRQAVDLRFDAFSERFLELYGKTEWAPRTYSNNASNIRRWLLPVWKAKSIAAMKRLDITEVLDRLPQDGPALRRNVFVLMRRMFNWAVERGEIGASPMHGLKPPKKLTERHHILSDSELICVAACAADLGPVWGALVRLLILTGQRLREVAEADWSEFDREALLWTIPKERTKNAREHVVPLSRLVVNELDVLNGGPDWPNQGLVICHFPERKVAGFSKMKRRLDEVLAQHAEPAVRPWRLHDLRRTVATNLQRIGVRFEVTEAILNHVSITQAGIIGNYQLHDWLPEKRTAMENWSNEIEVKLQVYLER